MEREWNSVLRAKKPIEYGDCCGKPQHIQQFSQFAHNRFWRILDSRI